MHPTVPGDYLAQFFWEHLQRDMEVLSKSLNLSKDDTALIVHSILRHISQLQHYPGKLHIIATLFSVAIVTATVCLACDAGLANKESRGKWETEFYQACVHPVLQDVQKHHQHALDLIANDDSQGYIFTEEF